MTGEVAKRFPRPDKMKGYHLRYMIKSLAGACALITVTAIYGKFVYMDGRKRDYAEYYRTYDDNKQFEKIRKLGLLQSCD